MKTLSKIVGFGLLFVTSPVFAQLTGPSQPSGPPPAATPPQPVADPGSEMPHSVSDYDQAPIDAERSDHERVIGHIGVGFFGVQRLPFSQFNGGDTGFALSDDEGNAITLNAPTIGMRWWLSELLALEFALGIHYSSGSTEVLVDGEGSAGDLPTTLGIAFHAGVPLALAHGSHYKFLVIPEINLGFASGSVDNPALDPQLDGFLLQVGARAGAEIHFGFIGVPQLALQGTIGLHLQVQSAGVNTFNRDSDVETDVSSTQVGLDTQVFEEPWDIFLGAITAIYYL